MIVHTNPDVPFVVHTKQIFAIETTSNPSTGYFWHVNYETDFFGYRGEDYVSRNTAVGSGGVTRFVFQALQAGKTHVELVCQRVGGRIRDRKCFVVHVVP